MMRCRSVESCGNLTKAGQERLHSSHLVHKHVCINYKDDVHQHLFQIQSPIRVKFIAKRIRIVAEMVFQGAFALALQ